MSAGESIVAFECAQHRCYGVLHTPESTAAHGMLIIGRTGSDRQGVHLARRGAAVGLPVFRFDFRGRGNSEGPVVSVEETEEDIACALDAFLKANASVRTVTLWGLSEGAAASLLYASSDPRVTGLVLVNPWIRMEHAVAKQHLKQNVVRVLDRHFWMRIRRTERGYLGAIRSFCTLVSNVIKAPKTKDTLKDRVIHGLKMFTGQVCIILSGEDPATAVFQQAAASHLARLTRNKRLTVHNLPEANHVFSRCDWRHQLIEWSTAWVKDSMPVHSN